MDDSKDASKAIGGKARAEKLSPERKAEIAKKAASARWEKQEQAGLPIATHKGELVLDGIVIPCAVLDNGIRVLSEVGITMALLGSRSGASKRLKESGAPLPIFVAPGMLKPFIDQELTDGPLRKISYVDGRRVVSGFDANLLPAVCDVWLKARQAGALQKQQLSKAQNAEILMRSLAKVAIVALVDEATGYQAERDKDALQKLLSIYLSEEKLKWAKTFPDEYYRQLFRLRGWPYSPMNMKRTQLIGKLTNIIVYEKLPPTVLDELRRLNPVVNKKTGRRHATFHQYLSADIGQVDLRDHLLQLIAVMRLSSNWKAFLNNFRKAFPGPDGYQEE